MKVVDANVLLYAVNEDSRHHATSMAWLDGALSGGSTVGFAWVAICAFLRLATRVDLFERPLPVDVAVDSVAAWLAQPAAVVVHPEPSHPRLVGELLAHVGSGGNLVNDAHLAALSIEQRGSVVSYDNDFARFPDVVWETPHA